MSGTVVTRSETAELTKTDQAFLQKVEGRAGARRLHLPPPAMPVGRLAVAALLVCAGILLLALTAAGAISLPNVGTLTVYLPVADQSTSVLLITGIGFAVGVLSGMTGVAGGFLLTPLLMSIGIPSSVAVGTGSAQFAGTASSGALAHSRLGNVDVKVALVMLVGSFVGGTIGVQIVHVLDQMGNFDFVVRMIYIVVLGSVGTMMLREAVRTWIRSARSRVISGLVDEGFEELKGRLAAPEQSEGGGSSRFASGWPLQAEFKKAGIRASLVLLVAMGLLIGLLTAIMGVGGGFIMVPAMIYILGMPTQVAVGTSLFQIVLTSSNVAFLQAITNHNVDILLAVLLLVGAAMGAQVGARLSTRLEGHQLRTFLGVIVVLVMFKILAEVVMAPGSLFALSG
jgi:uncharacterized membrane protein YfcA